MPTLTPNIGLQVPSFDQPNYQVALDYDLTLLDLIFGGSVQVPALNVLSLSIGSLNITAAQVIAALGYAPLNPANNLADVTSTAQALANLGGIGTGSVMGAWVSSTVYNVGNLVTYSGGAYISAVGANVGHEPDTSPSYWTAFLPYAASLATHEEAPAGAFPGTMYTLSFAPAQVLGMYYNGLLLQSTQYSISSTTLTLGFSTVSGDTLWAVYVKTGGIAALGTIQLHETPTGTINGTNPTFTLSYAPYPASSLIVFVQGLAQQLGVAYTVSGAVITFLSGYVPQTGWTLSALYTH